MLFVSFGAVVATLFPLLASFLQARGRSESEIGIVMAAMAGFEDVDGQVPRAHESLQW